MLLSIIFHINGYALSYSEITERRNQNLPSNQRWVCGFYGQAADILEGGTTVSKSGNTTTVTTDLRVEKKDNRGQYIRDKTTSSYLWNTSAIRALILTFNGNKFRGYYNNGGNVLKFDNADFAVLWYWTYNYELRDSLKPVDYDKWIDEYNSEHNLTGDDKFSVRFSTINVENGKSTYFNKSVYTLKNLPSECTGMYVLPITFWAGETASSDDATHSFYLLDSSTYMQSDKVEVSMGYNVTYNANGGSSTPSKAENVDKVTLPTVSRTGYTLDGWYNGSTKAGNAGATYTPTADVTLTAKWTPRTDTKYVVKHQLMNVNGSGYTLKDTETLKGTTDTSVTPATKTYTGFTAPAKQTVNINADGSRVVTYSYSRNKYTFTLGSNASVYSHGINTSGSSASGSYYYGATITLKASPKAGYTWSKWSDENTSTSRTLTMPANNLTITPQANLITYNIRYNLFKGSVSGNPATYTVETPTFTLKNPTLAGFTFLGWTSPANREAKTAYQIPKGSVGDITVSANWVSGKLSDDSLNTQGGNGSSDSGNSDNTDPDNARSKNTKTQHNNFKIG